MMMLMQEISRNTTPVLNKNIFRPWWDIDGYCHILSIPTGSWDFFHPKFSWYCKSRTCRLQASFDGLHLASTVSWFPLDCSCTQKLKLLLSRVQNEMHSKEHGWIKLHLRFSYLFFVLIWNTKTLQFLQVMFDYPTVADLTDFIVAQFSEGDDEAEGAVGGRFPQQRFGHLWKENHRMDLKSSKSQSCL